MSSRQSREQDARIGAQIKLVACTLSSRRGPNTEVGNSWGHCVHAAIAVVANLLNVPQHRINHLGSALLYVAPDVDTNPVLLAIQRLYAVRQLATWGRLQELGVDESLLEAARIRGLLTAESNKPDALVMLTHPGEEALSDITLSDRQYRTTVDFHVTAVSVFG